jgi:hypothetical protein
MLLMSLSADVSVSAASPDRWQDRDVAEAVANEGIEKRGPKCRLMLSQKRADLHQLMADTSGGL